MALFCDFENVALGVAEADYPKFDIRKVMERLLLKGSIVVKKAYCDWDRYKTFKRDMHEAAFELIEIPHVRQSGKNSADIRMVVDALDLCYTKSHVDCFVIISGDSDFSPLVSKLRENNKKVIGVGVRKSTSDLLIGNCDEFIFYDDLVLESIEARRKRAERQQGQQQARGNGRGGKPAGERGDKADDRSDKPAAERADKAERGNTTERGASADASAAERTAGQSRSSRSRRGRGRGEAAPAPADLFATDDGALPLSDAGDAAAMLDDRELPPDLADTNLDDAFADDALLAADDAPADADEATLPAASVDPDATVSDTTSAAASDDAAEAAPTDDNGSTDPDTIAPPEPEPATKPPRRPARKRTSKAAAASTESDATLAIDAPAPIAAGADAGTADGSPAIEPSAPAPKAKASRAKPRSRKAADAAPDASAAETLAPAAATDSPVAEPAAEPDAAGTKARPPTGADASAATPASPAPETNSLSALAEPPPVNEDEQRRLQALDWVIETIEALLNERGADERLWGSMVKQTLKRRKPGFNEAAYGYRAFNDLLADAERRGLLQLERDSKSGGALIRLV
ncbi:NYN domain-containing protein [Derxia gummosa]|uniref:NYN domain-containing protein n=1 Tax=Derxia gummosa DSM 723 TaxID=1121388 RepID=A0AC36KJY4_9BURK